MFSEKIVRPIAQYVRNNWVISPNTNFVKKQIGARAAYLGLTPVSAVTSVLDTLVGSIAGIGSILTLGLHKPTNDLHVRNIALSRLIVSLPFSGFLKVINPSAEFPGKTNENRILIGSQFDGLVFDFVLPKLKNYANEFSLSNNVFKKHVLSRLTFALTAIAAVVTRVADAAIGLVAAAFSIITLGIYPSLNNLAARGLHAPGVFHDIFYAAIKTINPWAVR